MPEFRHARIDKDAWAVRELFRDHLRWVNARLDEEFGLNFDVGTVLEDGMNHLDIYLPPDGRLILVSEESKSAGLGCLKKTRDDIGEIKRMYVRPEFRGRGFGRRLLQTLLSEARDIGYSRVRLDSARFMEAAHSLYRSAGFQEIEPYDESEIPPEFREHWIFMERSIAE